MITLMITSYSTVVVGRLDIMAKKKPRKDITTDSVSQATGTSL